MEGSEQNISKLKITHKYRNLSFTNAQSVFFIFALSGLVVTSFVPTLWAWFELNDDHYQIWMSQKTQVHQQLPARESVSDVMKSEIFGRGRVEPMAILVWEFMARNFIENPVLYRTVLLSLAVATAIFLFLAGQQFTNSSVGGFVFSAWLMICPAAQDMWPHIVRSETTGMLLIAIIMSCLLRQRSKNSFMGWISLGVFLVLSLYKESFFLLAPAFAWLAYSNQTNGTSMVNKSNLPISLGFLSIGLVVGLVIVLAVSQAGSESHGGQSLNIYSTQVLSRLIGPGGIIQTIAYNSLWCVPLILVFLKSLWRRQWPEAISPELVIFSVLVIAPQVLLYLTRSSFEGRYAFPMMIGVVLLNTMALKELFRKESRPLIKMLVAIFLFLGFARFTQIQVMESFNFMSRTNAVKSLVNEIATDVPDDGTIVIVGPPKTEHALALMTFIGYAGKPNTTVYLYQPNGSDGNTAYGFSKRDSIEYLSPNEIDAVIFLPGVDSIQGTSFPLGWPSQLTNRSISYESFYLSLRQMTVERITKKIRYSIALEESNGH